MCYDYFFCEDEVLSHVEVLLRMAINQDAFVSFNYFYTPDVERSLTEKARGREKEGEKLTSTANAP